MSERPHHRKPATFKLDDPGVVVMDADETGRPSRGTVRIAVLGSLPLAVHPGLPPQLDPKAEQLT